MVYFRTPSLHVCRALDSSDRGRLNQVGRGNPELRTWLNHAPNLLISGARDRYLMTVVEANERFEAFLCWVYLDECVLPGGDQLASVWFVRAWSLAIGINEGTSRTFYGGRAVELVYHTFNEAMSRNLSATCVCWLDTVDELTSLLKERCEFVAGSPPGSGVLIRPVLGRTPPPSQPGVSLSEGAPTP